MACIIKKSRSRKADVFYIKQSFVESGGKRFQRLIPCKDASEARELLPTVKEYEALKKYYGAEHVLPIYIETDDGERLCRALERERKERQPKYKELCRRFIADSEDFSEGKLCKAGITRRFVNDDLERCVSEIAVFIRETKGQRDLAG